MTPEMLKAVQAFYRFSKAVAAGLAQPENEFSPDGGQAAANEAFHAMKEAGAFQLGEGEFTALVEQVYPGYLEEFGKR